MICYEVGDSSSIDSLTRVERADPVPGPGQVVIDVKAASLNWRDLEIITGQFFFRKPDTRVPVSDGAGVVSAVGEGVTQFAIGDRVTCNHFSDWIAGPWDPDVYYPGDLGDNRDGFLADKALVPAHCVVRLPDNVSFEDAACLPAAGLTAWRMLFEMAQIKPSDTILTLGTGGVSMFTVQLAKLGGARVIVTSSSDEKLELMRSLGADIGINYLSRPDWDKVVMEATGGRGVQKVFDHAGPATMRLSMRSAAPGGMVFMVGRTAGEVEKQPNIVGAYRKNLSIHTLSAGPRVMLDDLVRAWGWSGLKPVIGGLYGFEEARDAFRFLKSGKHVGKVVIRIAE